MLILEYVHWADTATRELLDHLCRRLTDMRALLLLTYRSDELDRRRVLAGSLRLLDVGLFRIGSEEYADDEGGVGLATVTKKHVRIDRDEVVFENGHHRLVAIGGDDHLLGHHELLLDHLWRPASAGPAGVRLKADATTIVSSS